MGCSLQVRAVTSPQQDTWNSTSMYRTSYQSSSVATEQKTASWGYTPAARNISVNNPSFGQGAQLSSYFQSTSADELLSDYQYDGLGRNKARSGWGRPEEDPIGVIPNPIGEPLVLLFMALLYAVYRRRQTKANAS